MVDSGDFWTGLFVIGFINFLPEQSRAIDEGQFQVWSHGIHFRRSLGVSLVTRFFPHPIHRAGAAVIIGSADEPALPNLTDGHGSCSDGIIRRTIVRRSPPAIRILVHNVQRDLEKHGAGALVKRFNHVHLSALSRCDHQRLRCASEKSRSVFPPQIFARSASVKPSATSARVRFGYSLTSFNPCTPPPPSKSQPMPT